MQNTNDKTHRRSSSCQKSALRQSPFLAGDTTSSFMNISNFRDTEHHLGSAHPALLEVIEIIDNEDEELICLGGKRDLIKKGFSDEVSEIAVTGSPEEMNTSFNYSQTEVDKIDWQGTLLKEFNELLDGKRNKRRPKYIKDQPEPDFS